MGALFARFSNVAAASPHAWFPVKRTAAEIAEAGPRNRYIAFPHTKLMNAVADLRQRKLILGWKERSSGTTA